jgi:adenylate cyclase
MASRSPIPGNHLQRLRQRLRANALQSAITLAVFTLFILVASGNLEMVLQVKSGRSTLAAIVATPEFAVLLGVGIVMAVMLPLLSPIAGSLLTFVCMLPVYWLGYTVLKRPLIPMEFSLVTILVLYIVHVLLGYFREVHQKQEVIKLFGQYVPPALAARLGADPGAVDMLGEARELSIVFCDVWDFTSRAERLEPRELSALLNALFTPLTEIVHRHDGTIDKYMGDAMMAFWGAPLAEPRHAAKAVSAAFQMQEAVAALTPAFARRGWPALRIGIGINTGVAHVGNMGSQYRMAYTAIGDVVNLASRLESLTRVFGAPIIVGENTRRAFAAPTYRELGLVHVKGKQQLTRIFEPFQPSLDADSTVLARLHAHNTALACYYARDWDGAAARFGALHAQDPGDRLYGYYLERIREFRVTPPPPDWCGELRFSVF